MAIIQGQIQPLKEIKKTLEQNGIYRFTSIGEINSFLKNYDEEKGRVFELVKNEIDLEISQLHIEVIENQRVYDDLKDKVSNEVNLKLCELKEFLKVTQINSSKGFIYKILNYCKKKFLIYRISNLEGNSDNIVAKRTCFAKNEASNSQEKLNSCITNKDLLVLERSTQLLTELEKTKSVIDSLNSLIAGAIGENSVVNELQNLSDYFYIFNDFSISFNPPIYNKKGNDRIYSIQVDHLLVCEAGIFILETKNWNTQSIQNIDMRSPIKQIMRSSYALFVLLNSQSQHNINLAHHHWGSKQIPIRNLIVMTNAKPKEEFKHVKILSINELNNYITYFDRIFSKEEIESICHYLRIKMS